MRLNLEIEKINHQNILLETAVSELAVKIKKIFWPKKELTDC